MTAMPPGPASSRREALALAPVPDRGTDLLRVAARARSADRPPAAPLVGGGGPGPPGAGVAAAALELLVADSWLQCASEYRTFCVGRQVVAASPYLVEDEAWSPLLGLHRASFHEAAAAFVQAVLERVGRVPPAMVLDVARLVDGRFVVLETNTAWGAGLYGCDPDAVLSAVLAGQDSDDDEWVFDPGELPQPS